MKFTKIFLSILLILSTFTVLLTSCTGDNGNDDNNVTGDDEAMIDISEYKIIRADAENTKFIKYVSSFKKLLRSYTGADLTVESDYIEEGATLDESGYEILLGNTNRTLSKELAAELEKESDNASYIIKATENKIAIVGKTSDTTVRAFKLFLTEYAKTSSKDNTVTISAGKEKRGKVDFATTLFDNLTELKVNFTSDVVVPDKKSTSSYSYETLIELQHQPNEKNNGTLLAAHATLFGGNGYRVYKSTDEGKSWEYISTARDTTTQGVTDSCLQPCLFELPADVGTFKEGTLIMGACSRGMDRTGANTSFMTLYYSVDMGKTWKSYMNIASGGGADEMTGVWEPFFMYEEETGRVYCFYSDETGEKAGPDAQKLVYKYSTDMVTWSEVKYAINGTTPNYRPGMISIAKMGNGKYFMTYEMCGLSGCPIYYKVGNGLDDWGDIKDYGKPLISDGKTVGSAPWCAWTPEGGECGTLLVVAHHMITGKSSQGYGTTPAPDLFISFDYGETFTTIANPIPYDRADLSKNDNAQTKIGYSAFLGISSDGKTLYYLNNPPANEYNNKVVFASISIW